jgi:microcystin-dependent protein
MSEPFIGQISLFAGNFAPKGWAFCNGQTMAIQQNSALFAIIGTTYGGNGQTTFQLPNLQGRVPIGFGSAPGLSSYQLGQAGGEEAHTLVVNEMPAHTHPVTIGASNEAPSANRPGGNIPAEATAYSAPSAADATLGGVTAGLTGGGQPHNNMQPYLALNYIIALQGIFPARN